MKFKIKYINGQSSFFARGCFGVETKSGFALLIFVIIVSLSILMLMISVSKNQMNIAENVKKIISTEAGIEASLLCVKQVSLVLARFPNIDRVMVSEIKSIIITKNADYDSWINKNRYSNHGGQIGVETYNCNVIDFLPADLSSCSIRGSCINKAIVEGYNVFDGVGENNNIKLYIEWKTEKYRTFVSKIRFISNSSFSLSSL